MLLHLSTISAGVVSFENIIALNIPILRKGKPSFAPLDLLKQKLTVIDRESCRLPCGSLVTLRLGRPASVTSIP